MHPTVSPLAVLLSLAMLAGAEEVQPAVAGASGQRAFTDLARFYADPQVQPPTAAALAQLTGPSGPSAQEEAAAYLLAILRQAYADESNGRSDWRSLPYWGGGHENAARKLRAQVAKDLGAVAGGPAVLPLAEFMLEEDRLPEGQDSGLAILRRTHAAGFMPLAVRLLGQPYPVQRVLTGVLDELALRTQDPALASVTAAVQGLRHHPAEAVRAAAERTASALGLPAMPAFRPEDLFTPDWEARLGRMDAMLEEPLPPPAALRRVTITTDTPGDAPRHEVATLFAWALVEDDHGLTFLDWFEERSTLPTAPPSDPLPSEYRHVTSAAVGLEAAVDELLAIRATAVDPAKDSDEQRAAMDRLSVDGALTSQFQAPQITLPEALLALAAWRAEARLACARLLLPRIAASADERWLVEIVRDLLGHRYHQEMLEAFSARDYVYALTLARHLAKPCFAGYQYQERARQLAQDLPSRRDDFTTFVLPTPDQWRQQRATMPRADQVRYLADRLRLLNCVQSFQPGGVDYDDEQRAGPMRNRASAVVINPFTELRRLALTVAELPLLTPYLADSRFIPTFSYWRNFHPSRTLHQVNWVVAEVVDRVAHTRLADLRVFQAGDAELTRRELARIEAWCRDHHDRTAAELVLEEVRAADSKERRYDALRDAVALHVVDALPIVLDQVPTSKERPDTDDLSELCYRLPGPRALAAAEQWLGYPVDRTAFWSAATIVQHGGAQHPQRARALEVLLRVFKTPDGWEYAGEMCAPFLATADPALRDLLFAPFPPPGSVPRAESRRLLQVLVLAGQPQALDLVAAGLDDANLVVANAFAGMIGEWEATLVFPDEKASDAERATARLATRAWFARQAGLLRAGKPSQMKPSPFPPPGVQRWQVDAP